MKNENGFTLVEIIITIIAASILGSIAYQFMGTGMTGSALPVNRVKDQFVLNGIIEEMTADYRNFVVASNSISQELGDTNLIDFKEAVDCDKDDEDCENIYDYGEIEHVSEYIQPEDLNQGERILKVTLKKGDQTVTALFTRW